MRTANRVRVLFFLALAAGNLVALLPANAQERHMDVNKSTMTVHVGKTGVFSGFAHNHEIAAPITSGTVNTAAPLSVELRIDARALRVRDTDISAKDREQVQSTMLGPEVLDSERYPVIAFKSEAVDARDENRWNVRGQLTLHGETHPVNLEVVKKAGHYSGHASVKQSDFGMKPVKVAGGAVRVKDEVQVEFDVQLLP